MMNSFLASLGTTEGYPLALNTWVVPLELEKRNKPRS